jgi:hypothetical protein
VCAAVRPASSPGAIRSSLNERAKRIGDRIVEIETLPPGERAARAAASRGSNYKSLRGSVPVR